MSKENTSTVGAKINIPYGLNQRLMMIKIQDSESNKEAIIIKALEKYLSDREAVHREQ